MKVSYRWLCRYFDLEPDSSALPEPDRVAATLTALGLEVEDELIIGRRPEQLQGLVVGEVVECVPHSGADRLRVTQVNVGQPELLKIVCGAPNVEAGLKVVVAPVGTTLFPLNGEPLTIRMAKIRGEQSQGMLCAKMNWAWVRITTVCWSCPGKQYPVPPSSRSFLLRWIGCGPSD